MLSGEDGFTLGPKIRIFKDRRRLYGEPTSQDMADSEAPSTLASGRISPQPFLVPRQRPLPTSFMLHARFRIPILPRLPLRTPFIRIMDRFALHAAKLRHPFPDIHPIRIELLPLQMRVEDAEIGLRVHARAGAEPPSAVVGRKIAVDEMLHEVAFAAAPVEEEVFGQEGGDPHAGAVVHVAHVVELAHRGVDERVPRLTPTPFPEERLVVFPPDVGVFGFERLVHADVWPVDEDVLVEIPPCDLGYPAFDTGVPAVEGVGAVGVSSARDGRPGAECAGREVDAQHGGAVHGREIPRLLVRLGFFLEEFVQSPVRLVFAGRPHAPEPLLLLLGQSLVLWRLWDRSREDRCEIRAGSLGVWRGRIEELELMGMSVDICHPCAIPGRIYRILVAAAAGQFTRCHYTGIVHGSDRNASFPPFPRHESFPPQFIDLVFDIAEKVTGAPFLTQIKDPIRNPLSLLRRFDI